MAQSSSTRADALCSVAQRNKTFPPRALAEILGAQVVDALATCQAITKLAPFLKTGIQFATDFHVVQGGAVAEAHGVYGMLPLVVPDRVLVIK